MAATDSMRIPFNRPSMSEAALTQLHEAATGERHAGNGAASAKASALIRDLTGAEGAFLTTSGTAALELAALALNLGPADEVLLPAFTFVTTASAFARTGARLRFADVDPETLCMTRATAETRATERTTVVVSVNYGGLADRPYQLSRWAKSVGAHFVEDNAHGLGGTCDGRPLGSLAPLTALSFHETKNLSCGEGGALLINDPSLQELVETRFDKGTDRAAFEQGLVRSYSWVSLGSSFALSDLLAAVLVGELERFEFAQAARTAIWWRYHRELQDWSRRSGFTLPVIRSGVRPSGHLFFLMAPTQRERDRFISHMEDHGVQCVFHYQALNRSPYARANGMIDDCPVAEHAASVLVRLPIYPGLSSADVSRIIDAALRFRLR